MKVTLSTKPPQWKVALWARDSIEPAMLRVPLIIILFLALWGFNLYILDRAKIPYHSALSIKSANLSFVAVLTIGTIVLYSIDMTFLTSTIGWSIEQGIITFYLLATVIYFVPSIPGEDCRTHFNRLLKTVFFPGAVITFPEVLLADAMCSISKVLKDLGTTFVAIYAVFSNQNILEYHNSVMILVALMASLPFWIRIRQCYVQLDSCPDLIAKIPVLLNILKYFSSFPPIWLTAAASLGYSHPQMASWIAMAATVNTIYSFAWDTFMDWGLLSFHRDGRIIRRQRALFPWFLYFLAVPLNLVLRFSWLVNRLPGMNHIHSSIIVLMIEIGEVFRRAIWNFFRIEWEIINQQDKVLDKDVIDK